MFTPPLCRHSKNCNPLLSFLVTNAVLIVLKNMFGNMNNSTKKDNKLALKNSEKFFQKTELEINIHDFKNPELKIKVFLIIFHKNRTIQGHH